MCRNDRLNAEEQAFRLYAEDVLNRVGHFDRRSS
jgi:hypothetical protein